MAENQQNSEVRMETPSRNEFWLYLIILVAACGQWFIGGTLTSTGELQGLSLPVATLVLVAGAVMIFLLRKGKLVAPVIPWSHGLFLAAVCLGLAGMNRTDLPGALVKIAQLLEIFVVAWYLFYSAKGGSRSAAITAAGIVGLVLVLAGPADIHALRLFGLSDSKHEALVVISFPFLILLLGRSPVRVFWMIMALSSVVVGCNFSNGGLIASWTIVFGLTCFFTKKSRLIPALALILCTVALSLAVHSSETNPWRSFSSWYDSTHKKRLAIENSATWLAPAQYPFGGGLGHYKQTINSLKQFLPDTPHPDDKKIPRDANSQYLLILVEAGTPAAVMLYCLFVAMIFIGIQKIRAVRYHQDRAEAVAVTCAVLGLMLAGLFCVTLSRGIGIWAGAVLGLCAQYQPPVAGRRWIWRFIPFLLMLAGGLGIMLLVNRQPDNPDHRSAVNNYIVANFTAVNSVHPRPVIEIRTLVEDKPEPAIHVEAESSQRITGHFRIVQSNGASGNKALEIPRGAPRGESKASYDLDIPADGEYIFSARVLWGDGCSNSLAFAIGDSKFFISSETFNSWHVLESKHPLALKKGLVTLNVQDLEDGTTLDYFELRPCKRP